MRILTNLEPILAHLCFVSICKYCSQHIPVIAAKIKQIRKSNSVAAETIRHCTSFYITFFLIILLLYCGTKGNLKTITTTGPVYNDKLLTQGLTQPKLRLKQLIQIKKRIMQDIIFLGALHMSEPKL